MPMLDPNPYDPGAPIDYVGQPGALDPRWRALLSGQTGVTAPPLPPPVDVASRPVAGMGAPPVADPFGLGVGQSGTMEDAQLPPNATPTVGAAQPQSPPDVPPTSLMGRLGNIAGGAKSWIDDHRNTLMALGTGMAGAQSFGQGLNRAGQNVMPAMQQDVAQQKVNSTVAALMKRGLPQDAAIAAANNPTVLAQILPQAFGVKQRQFTQIGEDYLGNKKFGFVDPVAGKVYNLDGSDLAAGGGGGGTIPLDAAGQALRGQELLSHLDQTDPATAAGIKSLISGQTNPQARNLQKLAPLASLVDPAFDASQYPVRVAVRKSYTSGRDFQEMQALNTVGGHMGRLMESADGLGNTGFKPWNWLKNQTSDATIGNPALVKFRNDLVTTQNELARAYHGGHVSDGAFNAFNKSINEAQTPAEMRAAIGELAGLLQSKIEAKESGYRSSMAGTPLPSEYRAINDETKHSFDRIGNWVRGGPAAPTAAAPQAAPNAAPHAAPIAPPSPAVAALRQNPALAPQFDAKYGPGTAARVLGGQ